MPRKSPSYIPKREKNTEKSIAKDHFPYEPEPGFRGPRHIRPQIFSVDESILRANEDMKKIACFHHFLVALVVSLGNLKTGPDVLKVRSKNDDLHFPFFSCLPRPDADSFARAGDYGGLGWERHDEFKDGLLILIPSRPHYSDFHFAPSQKIEGRPQ
jgi:hypothetical protein